jgi:hypothetical protein
MSVFGARAAVAGNRAGRRSSDVAATIRAGCETAEITKAFNTDRRPLSHSRLVLYAVGKASSIRARIEPGDAV